MGLTIKQAKVTGTVDVVKKESGLAVSSKSHEVDVGETAYVGEMCHVSMRLGTTINTGNYESVQVQVSLMVPSTLEEIDDKMEFTKQWCITKLESIVEDLGLNK